MTLMQDIITIGGVQYRHYYMSDYKYILVTESVEPGEEPKPTKYIDALLRVDSELPPITVEATNESFPNDRYKEIPGYVVHLLDGKFYSTVLVLGTSNPNIIYLAEDVRTDLLDLANIDTYTFFYRDAEDIARQVEQKIDNALNTYYQLHVEELDAAKLELEQEFDSSITELNTSITNDINTAKTESQNYVDENYVPQTQKATLDLFGICKPDGSSIKVQDGVISVAISGKCIGEIVTSPIPIQDTGLKLLNGQTISDSGIYKDFIEHITQLRSTNPNLFTTSSAFDQSVSNYGVCGKFVYTETQTTYYSWGNMYWTTSETPQIGDDVYKGGQIYGTVTKYTSTPTEAIQVGGGGSPYSPRTSQYDTINTTKTVRLPKISGIIEGTLVESQLGNLTQAGLPNIKGECGSKSTTDDEPFSNCDGAYSSGALALTTKNTTYGGAGTGNGAGYCRITFDASKYNSIYKNNVNTVQPQTIKVYYYIVVANAVRATAAMDLSQIVAELNNKADASMINTLQTSVTQCNNSVENLTTQIVNKVDKSDLQDVIVVIETSDRSLAPRWYRVYSDGWCEQGGIVQISQGYADVLLSKSYLGVGYTILTNLTYLGNPQTYKAADIVATDTVTVNGFRILGSTNADTEIDGPSAIWYTAGYIF